MPVPVTEADLHCLVDGQVSGLRRSDLLNRIEGTRLADRLVAWQEQALFLQHTFASVMDEPLPPTLDAGLPFRTQSPPWQQGRAFSGPAGLSGSASRTREHRLTAGVAAAAVVVVGLAGAWTLAGFGRPEGRAWQALPPADPSSEVLAQRTAAPAVPDGLAATALPTGSIPDLSASGFMLVGVDVNRLEPPTLVFRYRNASSEIVSIGVARLGAAASRQPSALTWTVGAFAYAIAGTPSPDRIAAIAEPLRRAAD